jgi:integrase
VPKITKRAIDAAAPKAASYFLWCSELSGFGVRIQPSGRRTYYVDYRLHGRRKRFALGVHGKVTTEEARKLALSILGAVAKGEDPGAPRRGAITVADLCKRYMAAARQGAPFGKRRLPKRPSTLRQDQARIDRHIIPLLGARRVKDLSRADVAQFIRDVTIGKTAIVERTAKPRGKTVVTGGGGAATRTVNFLSAVLTFAINEGIIEYNPAHGVVRQAYGKRTRRLTPDEYRVLGRALRDAEREGERWQTITGVRLLALTGCRVGEITDLKWSEIDEWGHCFRLPWTKEGPNDRPIGKVVFDLLAVMERRDGDSFILWGVKNPDGPFGGMPKGLRRLMARVGLAGVTAHTLRHSFSTTASALGYPDAVVGALLGHAGTTVTSLYIHPLDPDLIEAADRTAARIDVFLNFSGNDP